MRCLALLVGVLILSSPRSVESQQPAKDKDPEFWLARAIGKIANCDTVEWDVSMEIIKAPAHQKSKYPIHVGFTDYHFRVKRRKVRETEFVQALSSLQKLGDGKIYWEEKVRGHGESPGRQVWGVGDVFHLRSSKSPDKLTRIELFQSDGMKDGVLARFLTGGVIGWRIGSGIDDETSRSPYGTMFVVSSPKWAKEVAVAGRDAVVLDAAVNVAACRYYPVGIARISIDRETHLMIERRTTLHNEMGEPIWIVNEVYSNWRLNKRIADAVFDPPPD